MKPLLPAVLLALLGACRPPEPAALQGYVEAEPLRIAAPVAGILSTLAVERGSQVLAGAPLFELESAREAEALAEAEAGLAAAEARLADLGKGARPEELRVIEAQHAQAQAAAKLAAGQLIRARELAARRLASPEALDEAVSRDAMSRQRLAELAAQLAAARLAARDDALRQAEAERGAARARVAQARWQLAQKRQTAPAAGLVQDTLFRPGEFVPAGQPVLNLWPPERLKIRFFVPEPRLPELKPGQAVRVACDGCGPAFPASVRYISPQAEYTPPVIYSTGNREKFVYLVEAWPAPERARSLHPGQPVDVTLAGGAP